MNRTTEKLLVSIAGELAHADNLKNVCHIRWHGEPLPADTEVARIVELERALIFPGFFGENDINRSNVGYHTGLELEEFYRLLVNQITAGLCFGYECELKLSVDAVCEKAREKATAIVGSLPRLRSMLEEDALALFDGDPATTMLEEVIYCYPGLRAMASYRLAHEMVKLEIPILPRMISEMAHRETGADIHPAAVIGSRCAIDHCTGVVIGATSIIGDDARIYQGVTLGARSFVTDENNRPVKGVPRHPIIGNRVTIYANATILGTVHIGDGAVIGGNVWLTGDVAPGEKVIQASANATPLHISPR